jgi:phage host-nuclease inhibitor protein Gam
VDVYATEAEQLIGDVQTYCEAHRFDLTLGGKKKSVAFPSGQVSWRKRPASIEISDAEAALADVVKQGLPQFLRTRYSIDKDAMLKDPDSAKSVASVTVKPGTEDFVIKTSA